MSFRTYFWCVLYYILTGVQTINNEGYDLKNLKESNCGLEIKSLLSNFRRLGRDPGSQESGGGIN